MMRGTEVLPRILTLFETRGSGFVSFFSCPEKNSGPGTRVKMEYNPPTYRGREAHGFPRSVLDRFVNPSHELLSAVFCLLSSVCCLLRAVSVL